MKYLILGSGFGLYGYLPAVLSKKNNTVYLEKKYKKIINSRKELTIYKNKIIWIQNYLSNLEIIDYLIIAKRPSDQVKIIKKIINKKNILKKIFLEKPIAKNPLAAKNLLNILKKKKINVSFGFIFQYTNWYKKIKNFIKENKKKNEIEITWNFNAFFLKKKVKSWKNDISQGGGIVNFYGIHFIKLINELGFNKIINSTQIKKNYWFSSYKKNKQIFKLKINISAKKNLFRIKLKSYSKNTSINLPNPFGKNNNFTKKDNRVVFLIKYLEYEIHKKTNYNELFIFTNFWEKIIKYNS
tara:strand:- start:49 stop:942 length:894 start_codon:yes stop_codon:yes gene_type:complete